MADRPDETNQLLGSKLRVVNIGLRGFADDMEAARTDVIHVTWAPPAVSDPKLAALLSKLGV